MGTRRLAPAAVPFPVAAPYAVRPDLHRLEPASVPAEVDPGPLTVFRIDETWPEVFDERLASLRAGPDAVRAVDERADAAGLKAAGLAIARRAASEWPEHVAVTGEAVALPHLGLRVEGDDAVAARPDEAGAGAERSALAMAALAGRPPGLRRLEALALALQEDLVLIGPGTAGEGRVAWLHVAFPSGWDPGAMGGASFERLHAPVPHAEVLRRAAPALVRAMLTKGPFVRYVWGVAPDGARSRHPRRAAAIEPGSPIERAWLRVERQTTLPLRSAGLALFAIHVVVTPLLRALAAPGRRAAWLAAVASLDPLARRYKGVPWSDAELASVPAASP